jgi:hypothetical protein
MAEENLIDRFLKDDSKTDELECFLATSGGGSQKEKGKIQFGYLEIEYKKNGRDILAIKSIEPHCPNILSGLEKDIDEALYTDHGTEVGESYFFTNRPIEGTFRLDDTLQIIPIPDNAPQIEPKTLLAEHPVILQFTYDKSSHTHINFYRRDKRSRELLMLLAVLIRGGVSWNSNSTKHWVWDIPDEGMEDYSFKYCQQGYSSRHEWSERDKSGFFIDENWPAIPKKPHAPYYGDIGFLIGEPFQLPETLEISLIRYHQLADEEAALFMRSAHWLVKCSEVYQQSHSLAYVSLVYALEGLLPAPTATGKCNGCGKISYDKSIQDSFGKLLNEYGADLPKDVVSEIYGLRSKIAHGGGLMPRDREVIGFRFSAEQNEKDTVYRRLRRVCEVVMINWLHSENRSLKTSDSTL